MRLLTYFSRVTKLDSRECFLSVRNYLKMARTMTMTAEFPIYDSKNSGLGHQSSRAEAPSATAHLIKRMTSGLPRISSIFNNVVQELILWEDIGTGFTEAPRGENFGVDSFIGLGLSTGLVSDIFFPYLHVALKVLLPLELEDEFKCPPPPDDCFVESTTCPNTVKNCVSDRSFGGYTDGSHGLLSQEPTLHMDDIQQRLDYIVTQIDVSRMARSVSNRLDVESINRLPTVVFQKDDPLICPSYSGGDDGSEGNIHGGAPLIEDYFNDVDNRESHDFNDRTPNFSWMVVPEDPREDEVTRMSSSIQALAVPESISICSSHHSNDIVNETVECLSMYENCVICRDAFQDGDCLRVLPCQHLFHCGCIDKWMLQGHPTDEWLSRGCPMCKDTSKISPHSQKVNDQSSVHDSPADTYHSDGSVPSWAFARLGGILSGSNDENHFVCRST
mmetsp:Transcript_10737/g.22553  ORF Transcript_10737/g.22553 Transcript_10737/m.22553 type:complete len:446 (+) Transcript_10737:478-1815(+)